AVVDAIDLERLGEGARRVEQQLSDLRSATQVALDLQVVGPDVVSRHLSLSWRRLLRPRSCGFALAPPSVVAPRSYEVCSLFSSLAARPTPAGRPAARSPERAAEPPRDPPAAPARHSR